MLQIVLDNQAGQVSADLVRRGIDVHPQVQGLVEVTEIGEPPMAAIAQPAGLDRLADEPDLYSNVDLVQGAGQEFAFGSIVWARFRSWVWRLPPWKS